MTVRVGDRRGFALPAVILLVALLTALLTTGLARARIEREIAEASDETAEALTIAESGLQSYLGTVATRPTDGDSVRINVIGGYANVIAHLVRQPADTLEPALYLVRSTGYVIVPATGATPRAARTIAQFAEWKLATILRRGALTAANGVQQRNGNSSLTFGGADYCGAAAPVAAIRTTTMTTVPPAAPPVYTGGGLVLEGSGLGAMVAAQTAIDWTEVLGGGITPDFTAFQNGDTTFSIQRVAGDLTLAGVQSGTGMVIVGGDLTLTGTSFDFRGILLVGGTVDFDGDLHTVRGLVVTGLNESLGLNPDRTEFGGNGKDVYVYYDSCVIARALARFAALSPIRNAWLDTWATY